MGAYIYELCNFSWSSFFKASHLCLTERYCGNSHFLFSLYVAFNGPPMTLQCLSSSNVFFHLFYGNSRIFWLPRGTLGSSVERTAGNADHSVLLVVILALWTCPRRWRFLLRTQTWNRCKNMAVVWLFFKSFNNGTLVNELSMKSLWPLPSISCIIRITTPALLAQLTSIHPADPASCFFQHILQC